MEICKQKTKHSVWWWFMLSLWLPGKWRSCPPSRGRESANRRATGAAASDDRGGWTGDLERYHPDPVWTHTLTWKIFYLFVSDIYSMAYYIMIRLKCNGFSQSMLFLFFKQPVESVRRVNLMHEVQKADGNEESFWVTQTFVLCFSLQRILGCACLDEVLDQRHVNPQNIIHNMTKVNKHGVVTLDDKTSGFIHQQ